MIVIYHQHVDTNRHAVVGAFLDGKTCVMESEAAWRVAGMLMALGVRCRLENGAGKWATFVEMFSYAVEGFGKAKKSTPAPDDPHLSERVLAEEARE